MCTTFGLVWASSFSCISSYAIDYQTFQGSATFFKTFNFKTMFCFSQGTHTARISHRKKHWCQYLLDISTVSKITLFCVFLNSLGKRRSLSPHFLKYHHSVLLTTNANFINVGHNPSKVQHNETKGMPVRELSTYLNLLYWNLWLGCDDSLPLRFFSEGKRSRKDLLDLM